MSTSVSDSPFSVRVIAIMLVIATVSFGAILVLAGWAPELRDRNRAGDHPYSTSAIGYNGLFQFLEASGYPVEITRLERDLEQRTSGLMIVTVPAYSYAEVFNKTFYQSPTLVVLPKWYGRTDALNPARQSDTRFIDAVLINDGLSLLDENAEIGRIEPPALVVTPFGEQAIKPDVRLQILMAPSLDVIVPAGAGALVAYDPVKNIYILSDPDILNTFGLADRGNARFAAQLIDYLRLSEDSPVLLDATLHGFVRSENLLKMLFSVPFIGATLTALASALLLGWAACIRFGPASRETRAIALGKQALADNSAGLVSMARREIHMAPGYLALIKRRLSRDIGAPKSLSDTDLSAMLDRLGSERESGLTFSQIEHGLRAPATSREDLVAKARTLHRWRKDILGRTLHERE